MIDRLEAETSRPELRSLFNAAGALHINFYEGWLSAQAVARNLQEVERLVDQLRPLAS